MKTLWLLTRAVGSLFFDLGKIIIVSALGIGIIFAFKAFFVVMLCIVGTLFLLVILILRACDLHDRDELRWKQEQIDRLGGLDEK